MTNIPNILEIVKLARRRNKLKREIIQNGKKIRDNRKRVELLENLLEYIQPGMSQEEVVAVIRNMKDDYEDRVDQHTLEGAEMTKERSDIKKTLREAGHKAIK